MIISRTPFRISFVGGGTDLRAFYKKEFGQVLSTTIDKYIYVAVKKQSDIAEYKYRINWSKVEFKQKIRDIEHPIIREALLLLKIDFPLEVTTFADIPAKSGLGSSSSFSVGLINALLALKGESVSKEKLAELGAKIEVDILKRNMGKQDHYAAAFGGLNIISFFSDESVEIKSLENKNFNTTILSDNLLLFFTGQTRDASKILASQSKNTLSKFETLKSMRNLVPRLEKAYLSSKFDLFGEYLHQNWLMKKTLTNKVSNTSIDVFYERALKAGAVGGKLLGAGGGGFICFYVKKENKQNVIDCLPELKHVDFNFENTGSQITYNDK